MIYVLSEVASSRVDTVIQANSGQHGPVPRQIQHPTEGAYTVRLVRGGCEVPVHFDLEDGKWRATVNGRPQSYAYTPIEVEALVLVCLLEGRLSRHPFVKLLAFGKPIAEERYQRMLDRLDWCAVHAPNDPCLFPYRPIDLSKLPSLW